MKKGGGHGPNGGVNDNTNKGGETRMGGCGPGGTNEGGMAHTRSEMRMQTRVEATV